MDSPRIQNNPHNKVHFLEAADKIGRKLCREAIWDTGRCTWMGWSIETVNHQWVTVYRSLRHDLYGGTSGVALFLAELYQFTKDKQQLKVIDGVLKQIFSHISVTSSSQNYGFYSGPAGIAYSLVRIGHLLQRDDLVIRGLNMMEELAAVAPSDAQLDVISGSAGMIPVCLTLAKTYQRPRLLEMAERHGTHLLQCAQKSDIGWSWDTMKVPGQQNLTGHSHGAAGIVTAFLELAEATGDVAFRHAAMEGLRYERHLFNSDVCNWPDLRVMPNTNHTEKMSVQNYYMGWCHGAPGIGLSRLRNVQLLPDRVEIREDLDAALKSTVATFTENWTTSNWNYSLCHGAAGNAELLIVAGQRFQRQPLIDIAEKIGQHGIDTYAKLGVAWPCGNGGAGETPNLMLGTAGIGYFYLRLFDPVAVPSILIITPSEQL
nr:type 2 lanthipeptide synthetase LanM [uncultured Undibacterium sp.]